MASEGYALPEGAPDPFPLPSFGWGGNRGSDVSILFHLYEVAWLQFIGDPIPSERTTRYLPVFLYSNVDATDPSTSWGLDPIYQGILTTLEETGFELVGALPLRSGSSWRELIFKTKEKLTGLELHARCKKAAEKMGEKLKAAANRIGKGIKTVEEGARTVNEIMEAYENLFEVGKKIVVVIGLGSALLGTEINQTEAQDRSQMQCPTVHEQTISPEDLYRNRNRSSELEKYAFPNIRKPDKPGQ